MNTVWVLVVIAQSGFWNIKVDVSTIIFSDAARCLRNIPVVREQLKEYREVTIQCVEQKVHPKDKKDDDK